MTDAFLLKLAIVLLLGSARADTYQNNGPGSITVTSDVHRVIPSHAVLCRYIYKTNVRESIALCGNMW